MLLSLERALDLANAAIQAGREQGLSLAVVVIDRGGHQIVTLRGENTGFINIRAAERKATASVNFGAPTADIHKMIAEDQLLLASVQSESSLSILPGGMPIMLNGELVGAIGIAGAHYSQDDAIARQAMETLA